MKRVTDEDLIWKALADPLRRQMLDELAGGPKTTGDLVAQFDHLCRTSVMKHLEILVDAGLVIASKKGRTRWNCINHLPLSTICQRWLNQHTKQMSKSIASLKELTESPFAS
jgi:DNA-binding transcriptional ArsR family regulator